MSPPENFETTVAAYVAMLCEAYGRTPTKATYMAYEAGLSGLDRQQIKSACLASLQQSRKFMPTPGELRELATTGGVTYESQAILAFEKLESALNENKPSLMPPLVSAVVRQLGGFDVLAAMPLSEFNTWKRKEFIAAFVSLAKENPERLAVLAGPTSEIGKALFEPMRIPNREETRAIEDKNRQAILSLK